MVPQLAGLQDDRFLTGVGASARDKPLADQIVVAKETSAAVDALKGWLNRQLGPTTRDAVKAGVEAVEGGGIQLGL